MNIWVCELLHLMRTLVGERKRDRRNTLLRLELGLRRPIEHPLREMLVRLVIPLLLHRMLPCIRAQSIARIIQLASNLEELPITDLLAILGRSAVLLDLRQGTAAVVIIVTVVLAVVMTVIVTFLAGSRRTLIDVPCKQVWTVPLDPSAVKMLQCLSMLLPLICVSLLVLTQVDRFGCGVHRAPT